MFVLLYLYIIVQFILQVFPEMSGYPAIQNWGIPLYGNPVCADPVCAVPQRADP